MCGELVKGDLSDVLGEALVVRRLGREGVAQAFTEADGISEGHCRREDQRSWSRSSAKGDRRPKLSTDGSAVEIDAPATDARQRAVSGEVREETTAQEQYVGSLEVRSDAEVRDPAAVYIEGIVLERCLKVSLNGDPTAAEVDCCGDMKSPRSDLLDAAATEIFSLEEEPTLELAGDEPRSDAVHGRSSPPPVD